MRCPNCKTKVSRFPLKDSNGKLIVKNLFKMDLISIMGFIIIILLVISYKADIKTCEEIVTNPLTYCKESNACKMIEEREIQFVNILDIPEINDTKW